MHETSLWKMRECPVCHATCFADMEICFGCLHRFDGSDAARRVTVPLPHVVSGELQEASARRANAALDEREEREDRGIMVRAVPSMGRHGSMTLRIDIPSTLLRPEE